MKVDAQNECGIGRALRECYGLMDRNTLKKKKKTNCVGTYVKESRINLRKLTKYFSFIATGPNYLIISKDV